MRLKALQVYGGVIGREAPPQTPPRRVLAIRPDHLGDLLLSEPALRHIKQSVPDCHLGLLIGPWNLEAAAGIPYVDEVVPLPFPWFDRQPKPGLMGPYRVLVDEAKRLKGWDTALVLRHDFWWGAMLAAKARIPRRVGYVRPEMRPFLTDAVEYSVGHEVEQTLRLAEALTLTPALSHQGRGDPPLEFRPSAEDREVAGRWLAERGLSREFAVVHPGAGAAVKEWSAERFAAVAGGLGLPVVVTGAASEGALVQAVAQGVHHTLVGAPLGEVAAVIEQASLAVGVDSGIMHLATAVGTPTVRLIGPVDPRRFGPWGDAELHRIVQADPSCVPCNRLDFPPEDLGLHPCIRVISVEAVLSAARELLRQVAGEGMLR